jgi:glycosyltransferase involved in cell wall biosynthesis
VSRVVSVQRDPLVSCIMPTRNRAEFVHQAVVYFQRQTVTQAELLVLDDGTVDLSPGLPNDERVRYVRVAGGGMMSLGAKRNRCVELSRGRFVAHWDDDDWYGPQRLEHQVAPLLAGTADVSALTTSVIFDLPEWRFWRLAPALHRRLFAQDVHAGTLMYDRRLWQQGIRFPSVSTAEDAHFLTRAVRSGARLARLSGDEMFVYLRHGDNAWRFSCGRYVDPCGWIPVGEPTHLAQDRAFYVAKHQMIIGHALCPRTPEAPAPRFT